MKFRTGKEILEIGKRYRIRYSDYYDDNVLVIRKEKVLSLVGRVDKQVIRYWCKGINGEGYFNLDSIKKCKIELIS